MDEIGENSSPPQTSSQLEQPQVRPETPIFDRMDYPTTIKEQGEWIAEEATLFDPIKKRLDFLYLMTPRKNKISTKSEKDFLGRRTETKLLRLQTSDTEAGVVNVLEIREIDDNGFPKLESEGFIVTINGLPKGITVKDTAEIERLQKQLKLQTEYVIPISPKDGKVSPYGLERTIYAHNPDKPIGTDTRELKELFMEPDEIKWLENLIKTAEPIPV